MKRNVFKSIVFALGLLFLTCNIFGKTSKKEIVNAYRVIRDADNKELIDALDVIGDQNKKDLIDALNVIRAVGCEREIDIHDSYWMIGGQSPFIKKLDVTNEIKDILVNAQLKVNWGKTKLTIKNPNGKIVFSKEYTKGDDIRVNKKFKPIIGTWVFKYDPSESSLASGSFKMTAIQEESLDAIKK